MKIFLSVFKNIFKLIGFVTAIILGAMLSIFTVSTAVMEITHQTANVKFNLVLTAISIVVVISSVTAAWESVCGIISVLSKRFTEWILRKRSANKGLIITKIIFLILFALLNLAAILFYISIGADGWIFDIVHFSGYSAYIIAAFFVLSLITIIALIVSHFKKLSKK